MSEMASRNKATVVRLVDRVVNNGALDELDGFIAPDFVAHGLGPSVGTGPEAMARLVSLWRRAFPDWRDTIVEVVAEGDLVVIRVDAAGTHRGPLLDIPATGVSVRWGMLEMLRLRDGRIVEQWGYSDFSEVVAKLRAASLAAGQDGAGPPRRRGMDL